LSAKPIGLTQSLSNKHYAVGTVVSRFAQNDFQPIGLTQSLSNKHYEAGTVVSRFAQNDFQPIGLTQSLSNKREAFVWLFPFSSAFTSKLATQP
jgi:hypothetical protein